LESLGMCVMDLRGVCISGVRDKKWGSRVDAHYFIGKALK